MFEENFFVEETELEREIRELNNLKREIQKAENALKNETRKILRRTRQKQLRKNIQPSRNFNATTDAQFTEYNETLVKMVHEFIQKQQKKQQKEQQKEQQKMSKLKKIIAGVTVTGIILGVSISYFRKTFRKKNKLSAPTMQRKT